MKNFITSVALTFFLLALSFTAKAQADGKGLFKQNCGACHTKTERKTVGPGLAGITEKRSEEWLLKWIKDSQKLVNSGDADAKAVFEANGKMVMPPFTVLADEDIKAILTYVKTPEELKPVETAVSYTSDNALKEAEMPNNVGVIVLLSIIIIGALVLVTRTMRKNVEQAYGENNDKIPLRDLLDSIYSNNKTIVFIVILITIAAVMKACIGELMP
jgi:mono/diheme cytochrome c family protein